MRRSRRWWWVVFAACALLALAALAWITRTSLELEARERRARVEAEHQEKLRLALWRMDSWLGPQLARESARPIHEYLAFYPKERAWTRMLNTIEPGEALGPSPLLGATPELLRLHFQLDQADRWSSPQAPEGDWRELALANLAGEERMREARADLAELARRTDRARLTDALSLAEADVAQLVGEPEPASSAWVASDTAALKQVFMNQLELAQRARTNYGAQEGLWKAAPAEQQQLMSCGIEPALVVGPLVPIWLPAASEGEAPELCYARRLSGGGHELVQGFLVDWPVLCAKLRERVADLLQEVRLIPLLEGARTADPSGLVLASLPARIDAPAPAPPALAFASPLRATLLASWIAALLALVASGLTLAASVAYGEKRSRFASTVTHELRTPLTTFRMYSEMLAKGMVPPEREAEYLATLERESERLSNLVENVLAYARLEDGRQPLARQRIEVGALLADARGELERRAAQAGLALALELDGASAIELDTDPRAVRQILFNLVDNACKYGRSPEARAIELEARAGESEVVLRVRDHGPGIPARHARSIFHPFERAGRTSTDPSAGVGLGLALARGLARDLGGELALEATLGRGATFRLTLRRALPEREQPQ